MAQIGKKTGLKVIIVNNIIKIGISGLLFLGCFIIEIMVPFVSKKLIELL